MIKKLNISNLKKLPRQPGVYIFFDDKNNVLYVGKAKNIYTRVKNHFSKQKSFRDSLFIDKVKNVGFEITNSEVEALIKESSLIKKLQPKFNVLLKDSSSYFWVGISKEICPRIFITHQPNNQAENNYLGPFVNGRALKTSLQLLRKIFPFRTCVKIPSRPCMWYHLGLCPAPCAIKKDKLLETKKTLKECRENTSMIQKILKNKKTSVINLLKKEMLYFSSKKEYERAAQRRDQIIALENVFSHSQILELLPKKKFSWQDTEPLLRQIINYPKKIKRIEGYDISNIQGQQATASMIVFEKGWPKKRDYRRFKIKTESKPNDIAMIKEALERRFSHSEWPLPQIIFVDGGRAQLNAALEVKNRKNHSTDIRIIAFAKRSNRLFIENTENPIGLKNLPEPVSDLILRIKDEAHRFAINYHKKLREKKLFSNTS